MKKKTYITYYRKNKVDMYKNQNTLSYLTKLFDWIKQNITKVLHCAHDSS